MLHDCFQKVTDLQLSHEAIQTPVWKMNSLLVKNRDDDVRKLSPVIGPL